MLDKFKLFGWGKTDYACQGTLADWNVLEPEKISKHKFMDYITGKNIFGFLILYFKDDKE